MRISDWSSDVCSSDLRPFLERTGWIAAFKSAVHWHSKPPAALPSSCRHHTPQTAPLTDRRCGKPLVRSEEHTSELQSLMRISYAVFCLNKKKNNTKHDSKRHKLQRKEARLIITIRQY